MSQPGYGNGPYPPDGPQQGWGGPGQPNQQPPPDQYGAPYGQQPPSGYGDQPASGPGYASPPASGPGYAGQPASGPGYASQPASGAGYPNQPASGPGFGSGPQPTAPFTPMPASGAPSYGADQGAAGQQHTMALPSMGTGPGAPGEPSRFGTEQPQRKRGPWIPVLTAATAVFLILAVTMTVMFVTKNGDYNNEKKVAASRQSTIDGQKKKIDDLGKQLDSTKKDLDKANQDLSGAKSTNKSLASDKATVAKCLSMLEDALVAAGKNDEKKYRELVKDLQAPCRKADALIR